MTMTTMQARFVLEICKSSSEYQTPVAGLYGANDDKVSEAWLNTASLKLFLPENVETYSKAAASAFARTSTCCIIRCRNKVEVGAHVTMDGKRVAIIPTHNAVGALHKLGLAARLKRNTVFLKLNLPQGKRIRKENGQYWYDVLESPEEVLDSSVFLNNIEEDLYEDDE